MTHSEILKFILDLTEDSIRKGISPRIYFDLDSTLFNVKPRLHKILQEFAHLETTTQSFPIASKILKSVREVSESYHLKEHLKNFGLEGHPQELYKEMFNYWKDRFFHSQYLLEDIPNEGAVEYVNELHDLGAHIIYLTGRDIERMLEGSVKSLKKWNFPIGTEKSMLIMKPHKEHDDAEFKRDHFNKLENKNVPIWFFENEPHNIHLILKDSPHVKVVYFDSVHSGKSPPPQGVPTIKHFKID